VCYIPRVHGNHGYLCDEDTYNNSYQESIKMVPFEALYGRKCRTSLNWIEPGERRYYGIDFVEEAEKKVCIIQQNMRVAQCHGTVQIIRAQVQKQSPK
jgi:hypothetical protein